MFCSVLSYADTWVTLENVDVDRCASAWLIKRFIDPTPEFVFFEQGNEPPEGTGYDFFGAKYFHNGADCTFTTLIKTYGLSQNKALQQINNDVNDVFAWRWRPGTFPVKFREHIGELRQRQSGDIRVYQDIYATLDLLYLSYGGEFKNYRFKSDELEQTLFLRVLLPVIKLDKNLSEYSEYAILVDIETWKKTIPDEIARMSSLPVEGWCSAIDEMLKANTVGPEPSSIASKTVLFRKQLICHRTDSKRPKKRPKSDPKATQKRPKSDPKATQKRIS